jgi:tRNA A-37 threonylcarbamoyl transferase component Bud32
MRWLDAVGHADTAGFHGDSLIAAWPYRRGMSAASGAEITNNMNFSPVLTGVRKLVTTRSLVLASGGTVGRPFLVPDTLAPSLIPSVVLRGTADRVLAEVDQDGFAFACDPVDIPFFNRRASRLPRHRSRVEVVLRAGAVVLRKQHLDPVGRDVRSWVWRRLGLNFYTEVAALSRLQGLPCVPQLREFHPHSRTLFMDFIWGENLRHRLAATGCPIFNVELDSDPMLRSLSDAERVHREFLLWSTLSEAARNRRALQDSMAAIHERGVAHRDLHLANVIIGNVTGQPYWIDFEVAHLRAHRRDWTKVVDNDRTLFRDTFGL